VIRAKLAAAPTGGAAPAEPAPPHAAASLRAALFARNSPCALTAAPIFFGANAARLTRLRGRGLAPRVRLEAQ
jgi:hypothetical protein